MKVNFAKSVRWLRKFLPVILLGPVALADNPTPSEKTISSTCTESAAASLRDDRNYLLWNETSKASPNPERSSNSPVRNPFPPFILKLYDSQTGHFKSLLDADFGGQVISVLITDEPGRAYAISASGKLWQFDVSGTNLTRKVIAQDCSASAIRPYNTKHFPSELILILKTLCDADLPENGQRFHLGSAGVFVERIGKEAYVLEVSSLPQHREKTFTLEPAWFSSIGFDVKDDRPFLTQNGITFAMTCGDEISPCIEDGSWSRPSHSWVENPVFFEDEHVVFKVCDEVISELREETSRILHIDAGTEDHPLFLTHRRVENPKGVAVTFEGGPNRFQRRSSVPADFWHQLDFDVLVVEYSGTFSPLGEVRTRLARNGHHAIEGDVALVKEYIDKTMPDLPVAFELISAGGVALGPIVDAFPDAPVLARVPWLQYRRPAEWVGGPGFEGAGLKSNMRRDEVVFGITDDMSDADAQAHLFGPEDCIPLKTGFFVFAEQDAVSRPEDLNLCPGHSVEIVVDGGSHQWQVASFRAAEDARASIAAELSPLFSEQP